MRNQVPASAESDSSILNRADAIRIRPARLHHVGLNERRKIPNFVQSALQRHDAHFFPAAM